MSISLWMCQNAKYHTGSIRCSKGHPLGNTHSRQVKRGDPLILGICQSCPDKDIMGPDIPRNERGWR